MFFPPSVLSFCNGVSGEFVSLLELKAERFLKNLSERKMEMDIINKEDECHGEKVEDGKQLPKAKIKGRDMTAPHRTC